MLDLFLGVVVRGESCRFCLLGMDALFESRDRALWTDQKKKKNETKSSDRQWDGCIGNEQRGL